MQSQNGQYQLKRIGQYELTGNKLGSGNYSKVHEAIDKQKNLRVALKIVDISMTKDSYIKKHYKREALILEKLKHPNIISLYGYLELPNNSFVLVLEAMPENLCDFTRGRCNGRLEESLARLIFRQLASAVTFIHDNGIIHRDIKLENVLYDQIRQRAKLTDFGLSNYWDKDQLLKTNCGSPEYSAPELHGCRPYDSAVDVWALGVVLFAMVVGRLPFEIFRMKPVNNQQRRDLFLEETKCGLKTKKHQNFLGNFPYRYKDLVSRMLNPNEHDRIKMPDVEKHSWVVQTNDEKPKKSKIYYRSQQTEEEKEIFNTTKNRTNYAARPQTARPPYQSQVNTYNMPQKTYAERPMTQAEKYRTLKPSHDYVYREQYLMQKYGSVYKT